MNELFYPGINMNEVIYPEDVIAVILSFLDVNKGDEATESLILAIGSELLDVSQDMMIEILEVGRRWMQ